MSRNGGLAPPTRCAIIGGERVPSMNDDFLARTSVLDLGRWYAAPLAARLLGDFGDSS